MKMYSIFSAHIKRFEVVIEKKSVEMKIDSGTFGLIVCCVRKAKLKRFTMDESHASKSMKILFAA